MKLKFVLQEIGDDVLRRLSQMKNKDPNDFYFTELEQKMMNDKYRCKRKYFNDLSHLNSYSLVFDLKKDIILPFSYIDLNNHCRMFHTFSVNHRTRHVFVGLFAKCDLPYLSLRVKETTFLEYHNLKKGDFVFTVANMYMFPSVAFPFETILVNTQDIIPLFADIKDRSIQKMLGGSGFFILPLEDTSQKNVIFYGRGCLISSITIELSNDKESCYHTLSYELKKRMSQKNVFNRYKKAPPIINLI